MLSMSLAEEHPCLALPSILKTQISNESLHIGTQMEACGLICTRHASDFHPENVKGPKTLEAESTTILRTRNYTILIKDTITDTTDQVMYHLHAEDLPLFRAPRPEDEDKRNHRLMKNKAHYQTSVRKLTDSTFFFPTSGLLDLVCSIDSVDNLTDIFSCIIQQSTDMISPSAVKINRGILDVKVKSAPSSNPANMRTLYVTDIDVADTPQELQILQEFVNAQCSLDNSTDELSVLVPLLNPENSLETDSVLHLTDCKASCIATVPRASLCSNLGQTVEYDVSLTFWTYLTVRVFVGMISGTAFAMFEGFRKSCENHWQGNLYSHAESFKLWLLTLHCLYDFEVSLYCRYRCNLVRSRNIHHYESRGRDNILSSASQAVIITTRRAVIAMLREHKGDYGLQRIYAAIGGMISSPLSGMLIDYASENKGYTDFRPAFYLYAGLKIISGFLMLTINLEFKSPAQNVVADVLTVLRKIEIVALFITCFILGTAWGYIESFLFWLLQDLGASRSLMGITITIGGIAGLPLLVMSGPIIDRIGHANVLFIGFIFYAIRLLGYSLIYNPWMCLIFEAMESITSSLAITAAVTYAAKLSTNTTDSSIQGLLGGIYFGVGKGSGSLVGGYLMKAVGTRPTYQIFSAVTLVTGCLYYAFNHFYIVKRIGGSEKENADNPFGCSIRPKLTPAAIEKQREAEEINNASHKTSKIKNNVKENSSAVKNCNPPVKYTTGVNNLNSSNHNSKNSRKVIDSGGVNLGYIDDESNSYRQSYLNSTDSRNEDKR
ncbi:hypothetical protein J6590_018623 [Homalodisca vitripennis]|nr:hypothetical protein J6590_018623 [Homalodisca vitripennis]